MTPRPQEDRLERAELLERRASPRSLDTGDDLLRLAELAATWLDRRFLDPLAGLLLPGLGDLIGSGLGLYMVLLARRRGLPPVVLARMLVNLAVDALLGAVPVAGDLFDVFYRAHVRNLRLLQRPPRSGARASDLLVLASAVALFLAAMAVPLALVVWLVSTLARGWGALGR